MIQDLMNTVFWSLGFDIIGTMLILFAGFMGGLTIATYGDDHKARYDKLPVEQED